MYDWHDELIVSLGVGIGIIMTVACFHDDLTRHTVKDVGEVYAQVAVVTQFTTDGNDIIVVDLGGKDPKNRYELVALPKGIATHTEQLHPTDWWLMGTSIRCLERWNDSPILVTYQY